MSDSKLSLAVRKALGASAAAVFTLAALSTAGAWSDMLQLGGKALAAEEGGHTGGHSGGPPPGKGPGSGGHGEEEDGEHGDDHGGGHSGSGGDGAGGGGYRGGRDGEGEHVPGSTGGRSGGGRPAWAREGIPEVELGRLNVSRAPAHVFARALEEALSEYDAAMAAFYSQDADAAAAQLAADYQNVLRIDSPLQNLSLYKELLSSGASPLPGVTPASLLDMAAIFLGTASDKAIPVSNDTVTAVNTILGLAPLSAADTQTLAAKAETVRSGIATGHGE